MTVASTAPSRARRVLRALLKMLAGVSLAFAVTGARCGPPGPKPDLSIQNANDLPTRVARGTDGRLYVTDAAAGSLFIYSADLTVQSELKELNRPLGVAVDPSGWIYVGNDGRDNVELYRPSGRMVREIGTGLIGMPNDLALDQEGNLYVADSANHTVSVWNSGGNRLREIGSPGSGEGQLSFPAALCIGYHSGSGELFVADQGNARVQVFDLQGGFLRSYGSQVEAFSKDWQGKFVKLQSLALDELGRLHAADSYLNRVQILDAQSGVFIDSYGSFGAGLGELNVPLDISISPAGEVAVANSGNRRVDIVYTVGQTP